MIKDVSSSNITLEYFFYLTSIHPIIDARNCDLDIFSYDNIPINNTLEKLFFQGNRITSDGLQKLLKNYKALVEIHLSDWWGLNEKKVIIFPKSEILLKATISGRRIDTSSGIKIHNAIKKNILKKYFE